MPKNIRLVKDGYTVFHCIIVGCGGNGSHFIRNLLQDISTHLNAIRNKARNQQFSVDITLVDGDKAERKNMDNQLFSEEDINLFKSEALADRYGSHYGIEVNAVTDYCKTIQMLEQLFQMEEVSRHTNVIPILISMVDNNRSRQLFDEFFFSNILDTLLYIDAGIEGVSVGNEPQESMDASGFTGQIVAGLKYKGQVILQPCTRVYEDMLEDAHTAFPEESCGEAIINNPQRCATNKMAAQLANNIMNNLFHTRSLHFHYVNFNAQTCVSRPVFIREEDRLRFNKINDIQESREEN